MDCALNQSRSFKGEDLLLLPTLLGSLNGTQSGSFVELGAYDGGSLIRIATCSSGALAGEVC